MIGLLTKVKIIDNSGGLVGRCIKLLKRKTAKIGDMIIISIIKVGKGSKIQKGEVQRALIVRTISTNHGIRWGDNAVTLVKGKDLTPIGSRIKGPISSKINNMKIISIAKNTI